MSASIPEVTFTPRASGDGTWYVEVASPGIGFGCEDVGDFRSRAAAEAWIRDMVRSCAASGVSDFGIYSVNVITADRDAS